MDFYKLIKYLLNKSNQIKNIIEFNSNKKIYKNKSLDEIKSFKNFITHIYYDTRKLGKEISETFDKEILKGFVFIKGEKYNPYGEIDKIISLKVNILFIESKFLDKILEKLKTIKNNIQIPFYLIISENNRLLLPWIIKFQYNFIDENFYICGVTGTNGKTTTVNLLKEALNSINNLSASIGTIGVHYKNLKDENKSIEIERTTPEIYDIFKYLKDLANEGIKNIFIEVSSIAAVLGRVESLSFDSIIFTNMTEDHLDFHKTLKNYYSSKLKFIDLLQNSPKNKKILIFNHDDPNSRLILEKLKQIKENSGSLDFFIITYGKNNIDSFYSKDKLYEENLLFNVFINSIKNNSGILKIDYKILNNKFKYTFQKDIEIEIQSNLIGEYNAYNIAAVLSVLYFKEINFDLIKNSFEKINVPGRLEKIRFNTNDIFIDYAHTEDALKNVLLTLKNSNYENIITVFGCGGDREKEKREKMGNIAEKYSDLVIVTDDNPRNEDEEIIINMILKGINNKDKVIVEKNRSKAIEIGISKLNELKNSCLLIAGKGHENYQEIKGEKIYFSDKNQVIKNLEKFKI